MSRLLRACLLVFSALFAGLRLFGQEFPVVHYTTDEGLPSNKIYDIYRDGKGFLWFSSDKGVARYDGIKFEKFTTFNGLPDNEIFFSEEDSYGRLWFGTFNGELSYYQNDTFHSAANTSFLKLPFKNSFLASVHPEKDRSVTIRFKESSIFLNVSKNEVSLFNLDNKYFQSRPFNIIHIAKIPKVGYKVYCHDSVIYINENCDIINIEKNYYNGLYCLFEQNSSYFYNDKFIFSNEMNVIGQFKKYKIGNSLLHRIYVDSENMFFAFNSGLVINDSFLIFGNDDVSGINQDNAGNYWVSTLNNGAYCLSRYFLATRLLDDAYQTPVVYSCVRNNHIFFTTENNNLYCLDNGRTECLFNYAEYKHGPVAPAMEPAYFLDSNYKYYLFYNNDNITIDNVLRKDRKLTRYANEEMSSGIKHVLLSNGLIYVQNRMRIMAIDYSHFKAGDETGDHVVYRANDDPHAERIFCMGKSADNSIWYSTIDNFYKIVDGRGVLQSQFKKILLKYFNFYGNYLVGYTHNNQLLIYGDIGKNMWMDSIAPQNCIWDKFYQLDSRHILISTNNQYRLLTINAENSEKKMSVVVIDNPIIPLQAESICADSANCYFFKDGAITSVSINTLLKTPNAPKLFFSMLRTSKRSFPMHEEAQIPFKESRNISISFFALSFGGSEATYQYSVTKNNQDNWIDLKGEEINFVNPEYGTYTIKVRAKTLSSAYSEPIVYTLHILRPFWASAWFVIIIVCLFVTGIGMTIRYRIIYILRKRERVYEAETRFLRSEYTALNALMNPHFIFNTLNNVQGLVNRNDKLAANEYLRVFADLIRQNMHNISKELIPLQKEIDLVTNYLLLEKLRFKELLNYSITVGDQVDLSEILIPPLLVQPLVENSIKHGILPLESTEGFIYVNVYERQGVLYIEVKDNGAGMVSKQNVKESTHESYGLENIKMRIKQLSIIQKKEITFSISEDTDDMGKKWTIATISMPVN